MNINSIDDLFQKNSLVNPSGSLGSAFCEALFCDLPWLDLGTGG